MKLKLEQVEKMIQGYYKSGKMEILDREYSDPNLKLIREHVRARLELNKNSIFFKQVEPGFTKTLALCLHSDISDLMDLKPKDRYRDLNIIGYKFFLFEKGIVFLHKRVTNNRWVQMACTEEDIQNGLALLMAQKGYTYSDEKIKSIQDKYKSSL